MGALGWEEQVVQMLHYQSYDLGWEITGITPRIVGFALEEVGRSAGGERSERAFAVSPS